jgi:hypothetical protein
MKKISIIVLILVVIIGLFWLTRSNDIKETGVPTTFSTYSNDTLGVSFDYPDRYFLEERDVDTTHRLHRQIVLLEDTEWNRKISRGEIADTEGPPAIMLDVFQNDLDRQSARDFITGSNNSNYKMGPGTIATSTKGDTVGLEYVWSGLYEGKSFVIANEDFVYMFSVTYMSPEDEIISDFEALLSTVEVL